jgi:hypothetical protein
MNLSNLNPDQKKMLILAGLVGTVALYSLGTFGVRPFLSRAGQASTDLRELQRQMDKAQQTLNREPQIREDSDRTTKHLREAATEHIPPVVNAMSWLAERIYRSARLVGVDIESVNDLGAATVPWQANDAANQRAFAPYTVRIAAQCGYRDLVRLLAALEHSNPYLCVSEIVIAAQPGEPERHRVTLSVEWPHWIDPEKAQPYASGQEAGHG